MLTVSGGPLWENTGQTQTLYLQSDIEKTFQATHTTHILGNGEFFVGAQRALHDRFLGQLGVALAYSGNAVLNGNVWEDANPELDNYSYSGKVSQTRLTIKGKLLSGLQWKVQPYVSAGTGIGFNRSHAFSITPKLFEEVAFPAFASNTKTAFTYTLGAGLQKKIHHNWQIGIGYEFADWGNSGFSAALNQTLGSGIQLSHLYTNELLISLSYIS